MKHAISSQKKIRESFWNYIKDIEENNEYSKEYRVKKKQNEYSVDIRCLYCDYLDNLRNDNLISEKLADKATL